MTGPVPRPLFPASVGIQSWGARVAPSLSRRRIPTRLHSSPRLLAKQNSAHFRIAHINGRSRFDANGKSALDRFTRADGFEPALKVWKFGELLAHSLGKPDPTDASHVGDGIATGQKFTPRQPRVHDAERTG